MHPFEFPGVHQRGYHIYYFAKQLGRPIYAYELTKQRWYRYNVHTKTFHSMRGGNFPLLYKKSAIVGARIAEGYPGWKMALAGLFERTLVCRQPPTPKEEEPMEEP